MSEGVRFRFTVEKLYTLPGRGIVVTGRVDEGSITVGASIGFVGADGRWVAGVVSAIEVSQTLVEAAEKGQAASLLLEGIRRKQLQPGAVLTEVPAGPVAPAGGDYTVETARPESVYRPAPVPRQDAGKPIHPSSEMWRIVLFGVVGVLILLFLMHLYGR